MTDKALEQALTDKGIVRPKIHGCYPLFTPQMYNQIVAAMKEVSGRTAEATPTDLLIKVSNWHEKNYIPDWDDNHFTFMNIVKEIDEYLYPNPLGEASAKESELSPEGKVIDTDYLKGVIWERNGMIEVLEKDIEKLRGEQNKWISVEEPPKKNGYYLVYDINTFSPTKVEMYRYAVYNDSWHWGADTYHPQFWQHLPAPPLADTPYTPELSRGYNCKLCGKQIAAGDFHDCTLEPMEFWEVANSAQQNGFAVKIIEELNKAIDGYWNYGTDYMKRNETEIMGWQQHSTNLIKKLSEGGQEAKAITWISVDERLPENSETVILRNDKLGVGAGFLGFDGFYLFQKHQKALRAVEQPTHWQPLPTQFESPSSPVDGFTCPLQPPTLCNYPDCNCNDFASPVDAGEKNER